MIHPHLPTPAGESVDTLIDSLLAEQRRLTAVDSFSRRHDSEVPLLERHYRDLIPLTAPRPGEQYAFEVDLDRCSGCKGCVTACHALNGLDDDESWRDVGVLFGEIAIPRAAGSAPGNQVLPVQRTVTTACHHCVEPACLLGCPVLAYEKDPATGIVRHLDDQCIGCSYCVMKCPYEVPRYSARRGIVRKCDLCHGRLAEGEAPACVQACPNEAIRVTTVSTAWVRMEFRTPSKPGKWLPDSPDPAITLPTTRYITRAPDAALRAADHFHSKPQPAHWPLILLLVGTQAGIGGLVLAAVLETVRNPSESNPRILRLALAAMAFLIAGLTGSVAHLGQPRKAWRVWLGWRTSWLSREAIALNAFAGAATTAAALIGLRAFSHSILSETPVGYYLIQLPPALWTLPLWGLAVAAVFAQTRVYSDTGRWCWRDAVTAPRFFGTMISLGCWLGLVLLGPVSALLHSVLLAGVIVANGLKLALELRAASGAGGSSLHPDESRRTVEFLCGTFRISHAIRLLIGLLAGLAIPLGLLTTGGPAATDASPSALFPMLALTCLGGEILERWLFFRTATPNRMPGLP